MNDEISVDSVYGVELYDEQGNNIITEYTPYNYLTTLPVKTGKYTYDMGDAHKGTLHIIYDPNSLATGEYGVYLWDYSIVDNRYIMIEGAMSDFGWSDILSSPAMRVFVERA